MQKSPTKNRKVMRYIETAILPNHALRGVTVVKPSSVTGS